MIKDKKMLNCKLFSQNHNSAEFQLILKCKKIGIEMHLQPISVSLGLS